MNEVHIQEFFDNPTEQIDAFAVGLARNFQQSLSYAWYCLTINVLSDKVFTPRNVYASHTVKVHLGLTGQNAGKYFFYM